MFSLLSPWLLELLRRVVLSFGVLNKLSINLNVSLKLIRNIHLKVDSSILFCSSYLTGPTFSKGDLFEWHKSVGPLSCSLSEDSLFSVRRGDGAAE
jgi:hypothetical protein